MAPRRKSTEAGDQGSQSFTGFGPRAAVLSRAGHAQRSGVVPGAQAGLRERGPAADGGADHCAGGGAGTTGRSAHGRSETVDVSDSPRRAILQRQEPVQNACRRGVESGRDQGFSRAALHSRLAGRVVHGFRILPSRTGPARGSAQGNRGGPRTIPGGRTSAPEGPANLEPGEALTRLPRGFEDVPAGPTAENLKLKSFVVHRDLSEASLGRPKLVKEIADFAEAALPLLKFGWEVL